MSRRPRWTKPCGNSGGSSRNLRVNPIVADYTGGVPALSRISGRKLVLYIGSSIGNFEPADAVRLLRRIRQTLRAGDALLLGADFAKSPKILVPAYDDPQGVTAAFNKNILARLNRELDADFDLDLFRHVALWNRRCFAHGDLSGEYWRPNRSSCRRSTWTSVFGPGRAHSHREQLQVHGRDDRIDPAGERLHAGANLVRPQEVVRRAPGAGVTITLASLLPHIAKNIFGVGHLKGHRGLQRVRQLRGRGARQSFIGDEEGARLHHRRQVGARQ